MKLPAVSESQRYRGLYVYDFGEWTALGYTAEEIAVLLESEAWRNGKVYKIVRATPDGRMELRGVAPERFQLESGMFFNRNDLEAGRADFSNLRQLGHSRAVPCRAFLHLADRGESKDAARYVTALIYPAEYEDEMSRWLLDAEYAAGDLVEGGPSHVSNYYADEKTILERQQLWSQPAIPSRSPEEVLSSVRRAVQR
ncbi:MAG: hypothetical protein KAY37_07605 [Phycisphaerae bacterium]|nr:hypothetical protein [Phycisphaerae bacterium]